LRLPHTNGIEGIVRVSRDGLSIGMHVETRMLHRHAETKANGGRVQEKEQRWEDLGNWDTQKDIEMWEDKETARAGQTHIGSLCGCACRIWQWDILQTVCRDEHLIHKVHDTVADSDVARHLCSVVVI
jgi:hypothetical protein